MAWRRPGNKPLSEPMMVILLTHICVTRPQWVKDIFGVFFANVSIRSRDSELYSYSRPPSYAPAKSLLWNHIEGDGVTNHQRLDCLLGRLFRSTSKKTSKLRVAGLCEGNHCWPVDSTHKGPITRKMFPFDDVITILSRFGQSRRWDTNDQQIYLIIFQPQPNIKMHYMKNSHDRTNFPKHDKSPSRSVGFQDISMIKSMFVNKDV